MGDKVIKKFKALRDLYTLVYKIADKGQIVDVEIVGNIYTTEVGRFHHSWFDAWLQDGKIVEITDESLDKNIVSSGKSVSNSDNIYSKKYNIYEILTLIPNLPKDTKFKCSLDDNMIFNYNDDAETLVQYDGIARNCYIVLESSFTLKEVLEATYTIINPDIKENWMPIKSRVEFMQAIIDCKPIRSNIDAEYSEWEYHKNYNIDDMIDLYVVDFGNFNIQYLEK